MTPEEIAEDIIGKDCQCGVEDSKCYYCQKAELIAAAIREAEDKYRLPLESLTVGGSEFHRDPERCVNFVKGVQRHQHETIKKYVKASRVPPEGHVLTPDGVVRRCLGELVLTADGCVMGEAAEVFVEYDDGVGGTYLHPHSTRSPLFKHASHRGVFSTRAAAEAASKAKQEPAHD